MGNRNGSQRADLAGGGDLQFNTRRRYQQHKREYCLQDEYRSKTLPARHQQQQQEPSSVDAGAEQQRQPRLETSSCLGSGNGGTSGNHNSGETTPRMLFLLYLIHRTWNVVMDTVDTRTKR